MKRAMSDAKLKCRYCHAVFTASTRLSPEVAPHIETLPVHVRAPQPEELRPFQSVSKRRLSLLVAGVVLLALLGAAALGAWLYHSYQQRRTNPATETTPVASGVENNP